MPTPKRLSYLAIRTLEEALIEAEAGPVNRTCGHRLALAWLASQNAGLDWHYKNFWEAMVQTTSGGIQDGGKYIRTTTMHMLLHYWRRTLELN